MVRMMTLLTEGDEVIEKFISLLPKYELEFHTPQSEHSFRWRGSMYPTVTNQDHSVKIGMDRTDIFDRNGEVWIGDPSHPILNGFVIQAVVTNPDQRGKGMARETLKRILRAADEAGIIFKLEPVPMKDFIKRGQKSMTKNQLRKWYTSQGFEKNTDANIMIRPPKSI